MSGRLYVHYQQQLIGQIQVAETGLMQFTYAPEWLAASNAFPISVSLPLDGSYSALTSHHFFANLLPEAETRQQTAFPLLEIQKLLKWTRFNWMVGNADAHAKNLSLRYDAEGTIGLAPIYDLVCTRNYRALARDLAMGIGGTFNPVFIGKPQLAALAVDFGVQRRLVLDVFDQLLDAIPGSLDAIVAEWSSRYGSSPIVARLPVIIRRNVRRIKTHWRASSK